MSIRTANEGVIALTIKSAASHHPPRRLIEYKIANRAAYHDNPITRNQGSPDAAATTSRTPYPVMSGYGFREMTADDTTNSRKRIFAGVEALWKGPDPLAAQRSILATSIMA
jgi:hypothetical protein